MGKYIVPTITLADAFDVPTGVVYGFFAIPAIGLFVISVLFLVGIVFCTSKDKDKKIKGLTFLEVSISVVLGIFGLIGMFLVSIYWDSHNLEEKLPIFFGQIVCYIPMLIAVGLILCLVYFINKKNQEY